MTSTKTSYIVTAALCAIVALICWLIRPFADVVDVRTVPIHFLTANQKTNLTEVSEKLNGMVIRAGEQFSFNRRVGPRLEARGFLPGKAFVNGVTVSTTGGGICVVSSSLYQLALECGLKIDARTPHLRTVRTVAPGLDATVWYGQTDLVFTNTTKSPLRIRTTCDANNFHIEFLGDRKQVPLCEVKTKVLSKFRNQSSVCVTRIQNGSTQIISTDLYALN